MTRYYEDLSVGDSFEFGPTTVTREEIVAYAEQFDPRPFHTDEEAARDSVFGELVASGWHTVSLVTRMRVEDVFDDIAGMAGRGVEDLRWPRPVRPGDTLSGTTSVVSRRPSETHDDRGYVDFESTVVNQDDETVLSMTSLGVIRRRP